MPNLAYNNSPIASSHKSVDFWAENWRVQIFYTTLLPKSALISTPNLGCTNLYILDHKQCVQICTFIPVVQLKFLKFKKKLFDYA